MTTAARAQYESYLRQMVQARGALLQAFNRGESSSAPVTRIDPTTGRVLETTSWWGEARRAFVNLYWIVRRTSAFAQQDLPDASILFPAPDRVSSLPTAQQEADAERRLARAGDLYVRVKNAYADSYDALDAAERRLREAGQLRGLAMLTSQAPPLRPGTDREVNRLVSVLALQLAVLQQQPNHQPLRDKVAESLAAATVIALSERPPGVSDETWAKLGEQLDLAAALVGDPIEVMERGSLETGRSPLVIVGAVVGVAALAFGLWRWMR
jgi:hypothetical protein